MDEEEGNKEWVRWAKYVSGYFTRLSGVLSDWMKRKSVVMSGWDE